MIKSTKTLNKLMTKELKTFDEIKGRVFDASGIDDPQNYLWKQEGLARVWYPATKISL